MHPVLVTQRQFWDEEQRDTVQKERNVVDEAGEGWGRKPPSSVLLSASVTPDQGVQFSPLGEPSGLSLNTWLEMRKVSESLNT